MALLILIITPIIAAIASALVRKRIIPLQIIAALAAPIELICVIIIALNVYLHQTYSFASIFTVDSLSLIFLLTIAIVYFAASFYSIGYLKEEVKKQIIYFQKVREYFVLFHLFSMAMFLSIMTVNPIIMWIAIEGTTLSTAFLISFYNKASATEAAWKYLIINSIGLLLGFFGTILFLTSTVNFGGEKLMDWQTLTLSAATLNPSIAKIAFIFVVIGYGTKMGLAPMHTWLPDAHSKAPPPISALLSGALLNIAFLAILRFKNLTDLAVGITFSQNLLIFFGTISIIIPAFIIIVQKNYKRLFAYSSTEHMGLIALGFGFGGLGVYASLLHMIYHSLTKSTLFFISGNIFLKYSTTKIEKVSNVLSKMPVTGILLILGFLAITGIPPFGMFITEFDILSAGIAGYPFVIIIVLVMLTLIFMGFLKHIVNMLYEDHHRDEEIKMGELNFLTIIPPIFLLSILIFLSIFLTPQLKSLINAATLLIY